MRSVEDWAIAWVLAYLLNSLWQVPLVFAVAWIAARGMAKMSAQAEHRVWVGALCLEVLLPGFAWMPSKWWRSLLLWGPADQRHGGGLISVVMGAGSGTGSLGLVGWLPVTLGTLYSTVLVYFAARFIWRLWNLVELRREAKSLALDREDASYWRQCLGRFGIEDVSLACSRQIAGPVALGFRRKLVLMPFEMASSLARQELHAVIAHEFAHLRRGDFLKNLFYEVLAMPVSYHPLLWLTQQRLRESREVVCDEMAAEVAGRQEYARSLLRLASLVLERGRNGHVIGIAVGIFDANVFERRVMRLTMKEDALSGIRRVAVMLGCAALAIGCCGTALALSMPVDPLVGAATGFQAPSNPKSIHVSAGEMTGNKIAGSNPVYPPDAKKAGVQGTVVLSAVISKEGTVENLQVMEGPKELQKASLDAVQNWKYRPYLLNGEPIEVETTINVVYALAK